MAATSLDIAAGSPSGHITGHFQRRRRIRLTRKRSAILFLYAVITCLILSKYIHNDKRSGHGKKSDAHSQDSDEFLVGDLQPKDPKDLVWPGPQEGHCAVRNGGCSSDYFCLLENSQPTSVFCVYKPDVTSWIECSPSEALPSQTIECVLTSKRQNLIVRTSGDAFEVRTRGGPLLELQTPPSGLSRRWKMSVKSSATQQGDGFVDVFLKGATEPITSAMIHVSTEGPKAKIKVEAPAKASCEVENGHCGDSMVCYKESDRDPVCLPRPDKTSWIECLPAIAHADDEIRCTITAKSKDMLIETAPTAFILETIGDAVEGFTLMEGRDSHWTVTGRAKNVGSTEMSLRLSEDSQFVAEAMVLVLAEGQSTAPAAIVTDDDVVEGEKNIEQEQPNKDEGGGGGGEMATANKAADVLEAVGEIVSLDDLKCSKTGKLWLLSYLKEESIVLRLLFDRRDEEGSTRSGVTMKGNALEFVKELLKAKKKSPNVEAKDRRCCLLPWALTNGILDVTKLLLENGTHPDALAPYQLSSLSLTLMVHDPRGTDAKAREERKEAVQLLLRHGADPNLSESKGDTALALAVQITACEDPEDMSLLTLLINGGADVNLVSKGISVLYTAVECKTLTISKTLLEHGADPNVVSNSEGKEGTPLGAACRDGHLELVQELLKKGASVNVSCIGASPLIWAVFSREVEVVRLLLEHGAGLNTSTTNEALLECVGAKETTTPLVLAVVTCGVDIVKALLSAGADVRRGSPVLNAVRWRWRGVMDLTIEKQTAEGFGDAEILTALVENGADCNEVSEEGYTVLWWAVAKRKVEVVKLLLKGGADPNVVQTPDKETALGYAARRGWLDIVTELIKGGADVNLCSKGACPLILAVQCENEEVVRVLLESGADPNVRVCNRHDGVHSVIPSGETGVPLLWNLMSIWNTAAGVVLKYGADVTYREGEETLLSLAARWADPILVKDLLSRGMKPSDDNSFGVMCSCFVEGSIEYFSMVKMLVEHGADVNKRYLDNTPIEHLLTCDQIPKEAIMFLLENGADPNNNLLLKYFSDVILKSAVDDEDIINPNKLVKEVVSDEIVAHLFKRRDAGSCLVGQIEAWFQSGNTVASPPPGLVPLCLFALAYHTPQVFEQKLAVMWSFLEAKLWSRSAAKDLVLGVIWAFGRASGSAQQSEHPNESSARLGRRFVETVCNQKTVEYLIQVIANISDESLLIWFDWCLGVGMIPMWQAVLKRRRFGVAISKLKLFREESVLPQLLAQTDMTMLHKGLEVEFVNEPGAGDALRRELFVLMAKELKAAGLFESMDGGRTFHPSRSAVLTVPNHIDLLTLTGNLMWLALCYGEPFPLRLSFPLLKLLVGSAVMARDLDVVDHDLYTNLVWIRSISDPDELSKLDLTFTVTFANNQREVLCDEKELKPGGRSLAVTMENREEYISSYALERLMGGASREIGAFLTGFLFCQTPMTRQDIKSFLTPLQMDVLIAGQQTINVSEWEGSTKYEGGFNALSNVVVWFWEMVKDMDDSQRATLLSFVTGSCSVPAGGFSCLSGYQGGLSPFCISKKEGNASTLPSARVCFNTLCLTEYPSKEVLETRVLFAINEGSNQFGVV